MGPSPYPVTVSSADVGIGTLLQGRYRIVRRLGAGGLGTAYLAEDQLWSRLVALKLVRTAEPPLLEVLHREFELLSATFHPSLAQVHDLSLVASPGGTICFYTAEYVDGVTLGAFARERSWPKVVRAFADALRALGYLHGLGIRHGDFKPENVLVAAGARDAPGGLNGALAKPPGALAEPRGVLIDLSCARPLPASGPTARRAGRRATRDEPTAAGVVAGTPGFLAPEQLAGERVDERADLYAVGVTLGQLLPTLGSPAPPAVERLAERLTHARADKRPASVDEVLEVLGEEPCLVHPVQSVLGGLVGRSAPIARATSLLETIGAPSDEMNGRLPAPRLLHLVGPSNSGRSRLLREIKWRAEHRVRVAEASPDAPRSLAALLADMELAESPSSALVGLVDDAHRGSAAERERLRAVAARLTGAEATLLVVASDGSLALDGPAVERIELRPLERRDLADWLGSSVSRTACACLLRVSQGLPGVVRRVLDALAAGHLTEEDLVGSAHRLPAHLLGPMPQGGSGPHRAEPTDREPPREAQEGALAPAERRALGLLVAYDDRLSAGELAELGVERTALAALLARGLVTREQGGFRAQRRLAAAAEVELSNDDRDHHAALARWLTARHDATARITTRSEAAALAIVHHVAARATDEAIELARAYEGLVAVAPNAWQLAVRALERQATTLDVALLLARIEQESGRHAAAAKRLDLVAAACAAPATDAADATATRSGSSTSAGGDADAAPLLRAQLALQRGACALGAGELAAALVAFEAVLQLVGPPAERPVHARAAAHVDLARAAAHVDLARAAAHVDLARAAAHVGLAQTRLRAGSHGHALEHARTAVQLLGAVVEERSDAGALHGLRRGPLLVDALQSAALAASGVGERAEAATHLERALEALEQLDDPRRRARVLGARAVLAYEAGRLADAAADHRRVLAIVEEHGLRDRVANAALNLGTVCHQQARWADALDGYRRGLRAGLRAGQRHTCALLRFNLAKLYADLGQLERATQHAEQCRAAALELGDGMLLAAADSVGAEIALACGDPLRAHELASRAREGLRAHGSRREQAEIELQLAEISLAGLDQAPAGSAPTETATIDPIGVASEHHTLAAELLRGLEASDVEQRALLIRARIAAHRQALPEAIEQAEAVVVHSLAVGFVDFAAEAERWVARFWQSLGATALAQKHETQARERWERCVAGLPSTFHASFWSHPRRASLAVATPKPPPALDTTEPQRERAGATVRERELERLLAINQRLNSTLETSEVLEQAMDAAIELSGAERGFLLLARAAGSSRAAGPGGSAAPEPPAAPAVVPVALEAAPTKLEPSEAGPMGLEPSETAPMALAVARNFERAPLDAAGQAFSRAIAARVLASGEPLVTADARADARFAAGSSVHLMNLKSVACVPVVSPRGVLGVIYLDNRYQRGRFRVDDVELLLAFANQVAIALDNARLHEELRQRNAELEVERQRVEELARGQAEEIDRLSAEVRRSRVVREHRFDYGTIVGRSRALEEVLGLLDRIIDTDLPVLVQGESGTGKELVVRAIHHNSPRAARRLVAINCAALPESLLESELFGYERGAFTGADRARDGLVVQAEGGTLFLDEIGEMPKAMQAKLLRVLQQREVQPLGSARAVPVDFRLVCATNRRLRDEAAAGRFREDLYYRLSAVELELPPLRDRAEDIPELVAFLLGRVAAELRRPKPEISPAALRKLVAFDWPGNVRQLEHVITKAAALAEAGRIEAADVELPTARALAALRDGRREHREQEIARIAAALADNRWNVARVARLLGIPRPTLYRRIERYGIRPGPR